MTMGEISWMPQEPRISLALLKIALPVFYTSLLLVPLEPNPKKSHLKKQEVPLIGGNVQRRVEKWPTLEKIEQKREQRRNWQLGEKQKRLTLLHVDVADRSLRLMTVDAWKPVSAVDQFYKKAGSFLTLPLTSIAFCNL
jgi:hypothetical protein